MTELENALKVLVKHLEADKEKGSYYHSWQSNIALKIFTRANLSLNACNDIAKEFLEYLIKTQ
jgi:hypothetical protein